MEIIKHSEPPMAAGTFLKDLLKGSGIGQIILSQDTGLSTKTINAICKNKVRITPKAAVLLEKYLPPYPAEFWLKMDMDLQVYIEKRQLEKDLALEWLKISAEDPANQDA